MAIEYEGRYHLFWRVARSFALNGHLLVTQTAAVANAMTLIARKSEQRTRRAHGFQRAPHECHAKWAAVLAPLQGVEHLVRVCARQSHWHLHLVD